MLRILPKGITLPYKMLRLCLVCFLALSSVSALWIPTHEDLQFPTDEELLQTLQNLKTGKRHVFSSMAELAQVQEKHDQDFNLLIKTGKRDLRVKLQPVYNLVKPDAKVYVHKGGKITKRSLDSDVHLSQYQGEMEGIEGRVALTRTKNGWRGMIMTEEENLLLHDVPASKDGEHLMYEMKKKATRGTHISSSDVDVSQDAIPAVTVDLSKLEDLLNAQTTTKAPDMKKRDLELDLPLKETGSESSQLKISERSETNREYELEVAVFVDEDQVDYIKTRYPNEDPFQRLQTNLYLILNTVHGRYQSRMIKDKINIVLTEVTIFEDNPRSLTKTRSIIKYLERFCTYDASINVNGAKYDLGILLTGLDLYGTSPSDTGVAGATYTSGMCRHDLKKSCLVTEAHGFLSAFAIAHEIGHSLNMSHDNVDNDCKDMYLMGPVIDEGVVGFSKCSKRELRNEMIYLDDFGRNCMRTPAALANSREIILGRLPGLDLEENGQCIFLFGAGSKDLYLDKHYCSSLTCELPNGVSQTLGYPPIDGSKCGEKRMCYFTNCVNRDKKIARMKKQKDKPSGLSGEPLTPDELCEKYVDTSYTYVTAKDMNVYISLYNWSPMCSFHILCTNGYKFRFLEMPPPVGTPCDVMDETKVCDNFECA